jgi:glycerol-3-phosphate dehydrogenase (NAD(P)+)
MKNKKIALVGGGSWGTALFHVLQENNNDLVWWHRKESAIHYILKHKRNSKYLPSLELNISEKHLSTQVQDTIQQSDIVLFAVPSPYLPGLLKKCPRNILRDKIVVSAIKGIIPRKKILISEYFHEKFDVQPENFLFLTGPSHAEEVARKRITYITLASLNNNLLSDFDDIIRNSYIHCIHSHDVIGLEFASILKNIYAIAAGICYSLGYGDNFISVLVSNAISEMHSFLSIINTHNRNLMTSGYIGDLMVTAFSKFSRNRTFGEMIGRGYTVESSLLDMKMIPEGYYCVNSFHKMLPKYRVPMPVVQAVYKILYKGKNPESVITRLSGCFY